MGKFVHVCEQVQVDVHFTLMSRPEISPQFIVYLGNVGYSKRAIIVFFIVTSTIVCFKKSEVKEMMKEIKRGDADWLPAVVFAGRLPVSVTPCCGTARQHVLLS